jgi:NDP-sugar pyrophosphorylase family protein
MASATTHLPIDLFVDLSKCQDGKRFAGRSVFQCVGKPLGEFLSAFLDELGVGDGPKVLGDVAEGAYLKGRVYVAKGAKVEPTAYVEGPCYIGPDAEVRHGAYIRGNVYVGKDAVVGHTTEVKGSVFFDDAKAGHFAYVGDGVLGRSVNLGAGTKLANLPLRRAEVRVKHPTTGEIVSSGLTKLSAIIGDEAQTGCNAVLSPGTLLMQRTAVMPCVHFRGTLTSGIAR